MISYLSNIIKGSSIQLKDLIPVTTLKFNKTILKWESFNHDQIKVDSLNKNQISFITYNVWFETHNWTNRLKELSKIFSTYSPDFLCLQEVTQDFMMILLNNDFIKDNYFISGNFTGGYDVLILSKYQSKFYTTGDDFPSKMGRKILITEILINDKGDSIGVATSHFESLNNAQFRKQQLDIAFKILKNFKNSVLMGDFNFDPSWKHEQSYIDKDYKDSWWLHIEKNGLNDYEGYTMPATHQFKEWRPDRILFRSEGGKIKFNHFEKVGTYNIELNPQESYSHVKTPSDHYGLYGIYDIEI
jgi:tyrosyl-DNA phosphodiesterase 2